MTKAAAQQPASHTPGQVRKLVEYRLEDALGVLVNAGRMNKYRWEDALGVSLIFYISLVSLFKFDINYDTLAYHLTYAGYRVGLISPHQFGLPPRLAHCLAGFPPVADLVQGGLWRLFGRPEATQLITTLGVLALSLYLRLAYKVGMVWTVMVFLAVPVLQTALNSSYLDLWTNCFFTIHLFAGIKSGEQDKNSRAHTALSCAALAVAVNSKEQFFIIGAISFSLLFLWRLAGVLRTGKGGWKSVPAQELLIMAAAWPIVFFGPLRDFVLFGNPLYPWGFKVAGHVFPGPDGNEWTGPDNLAHVSQPIRYLLSQLDLEAANLRPDGYTLDQGNQVGGPGLPGESMGGSLAVLLLTALAYLVLCLRRGLRPVRPSVAVLFLILVGLVAVFPGSHTLRYFCFVEIVTLLAVLLLLRARASAPEAGDPSFRAFELSFKILLICSATYTASLNGFSHLLWPRHQRVERYLEGPRNQLLAMTKDHKVVCYARPDHLAIFYSPVMNAKKIKRDYDFLWALSPADCPAGSAVIQ